MRDWIRRALTRTVTLPTKGKRGKKTEKVQVAPSGRLVYGAALALVFFAGMAGLQIAHLIVLREWNEGLWAAIAGMVGLIVGFFFGGRT